MHLVWVYFLLFGIYQSHPLKREPPHVVVDLDAPPDMRWSELLELKGAYLKQMMPTLLGAMRIQNPTLYKFLTIYVEKYSPHREFINELKGIAKHTGLSFHEIALYNYYYELNAFGCTSLIVRDSFNHLWLGRNLDYFLVDIFANLTVMVTFKRGGKVLYISEVLAGFVGTTTAMKPGKFAVSLNLRKVKSFAKIFSHLLRTSFVPNLYLLRQAMESAENWDQAVEILGKTKVAAPCYYIIAGVAPHEGAVLERGFSGTDTYVTFADSPEFWFIVKTNHDHGKPDPDTRYNKAVEHLRELHRENVDGRRLMDDIMARKPNKHSGTIFTVVYSPISNYREMKVWH